MGSMLSYPVVSAITAGLSGATIGSIAGASIGMNIGSSFETFDAIVSMYIGMCIGSVIGIGTAVMILRGINKIWNVLINPMLISVYVGKHKFSIWANSENTIFGIKERIARKTEIDLPKLKLIHNDRELITGTLLSNGISDSTLFVESGLDLHLSLTDDKVLFLVCEDMKASELYKLVRSSQMINFDSKYIEIGGQRLEEDSRTLKEYGVLRGSFIYIKDRNPIINFCCRGDIKLPVSARQAHKVLQLKDIVESERGIDSKKQCLKFNGNILNSEKSIGSYGIRDGDEIVLIEYD